MENNINLETTFIANVVVKHFEEFQMLPLQLREDKEYLLQLLKIQPEIFHAMQISNCKLVTDTDVLMGALNVPETSRLSRIDGRGDGTKRTKNHYELFIKHLNRPISVEYIKYYQKKLTVDESISTKIHKINGDVYNYSSDKLQNDVSFSGACIEATPSSYQYFNDNMKGNTDIASLAMDKNLLNLQYISGSAVNNKHLFEYVTDKIISSSSYNEKTNEYNILDNNKPHGGFLNKQELFVYLSKFNEVFFDNQNLKIRELVQIYPNLIGMVNNTNLQNDKGLLLSSIRTLENLHNFGEIKLNLENQNDYEIARTFIKIDADLMTLFSEDLKNNIDLVHMMIHSKNGHWDRQHVGEKLINQHLTADNFKKAYLILKERIKLDKDIDEPTSQAGKFKI